jgi:hypothetical protein
VVENFSAFILRWYSIHQFVVDTSELRRCVPF